MLTGQSPCNRTRPFLRAIPLTQYQCQMVSSKRLDPAPVVSRTGVNTDGRAIGKSVKLRFRSSVIFVVAELAIQASCAPSMLLWAPALFLPVPPHVARRAPDHGARWCDCTSFATFSPYKKKKKKGFRNTPFRERTIIARERRSPTMWPRASDVVSSVVWKYRNPCGRGVLALRHWLTAA